jgi:hypothetical protein
MIGKARKEGQSYPKAIQSILSLKVLVAVLVAGFFFALLNDLLTCPEAFTRRIGTWFSTVDSADYKARFPGQWALLKKLWRILILSFGWPMLVMFLASLVYGFTKYRWKIFMGILPFVAFYVIIVMRIGLVSMRFLIPAYPGFVLLIGIAVADWLRWKKIPTAVRMTPIVVVYVLSFFYAFSSNLDMLNDTRRLAANWFVQNVDRNTHVAAISWVSYVPRLDTKGFSYSIRNVPYPMTVQLLKKPPAYPKYLIVPDRAYNSYKFDPKFKEALFDGSLGYHEILRLNNRDLYPLRWLITMVGRPVNTKGYLAPEIVVFERQ